MEKWEAAHITKNLEILIKNTKCSAVMKAGLKARELLTDEEDERLTALGRNEGSISEAKMMYEIMMTRPRGYNGLKEVLRDARQDGALNILLEGFQQPESQVAYADSMTQLLNMRVHLANCTKSFSEVFPNFTIEDAKDLLQNGDIKQELDEIFRKRSVEIQLDGELPVVSERYIPRLLSNRLQLDPRVFALDSCDDTFVFTNINRMDLAQLVKPSAVRSCTNQRSLVTARHIYLDHEEDWDDMVAVSQCPIHLVSKEKDRYILQRTTTVTDVLQSHVFRVGRSKEAFVTEDAFSNELMSEQDSNGALICDVAGMGKTWLMQSLAAKLRDKNQNFVVFFVDLASFCKYMSDLDHSPPNQQALTTVLDYACPSKLSSQLLHKYATNSGPNVVFVFDGYDEISKDAIEVVNSYLLDVSKFDHTRMIISSRPNMRAMLQKTFNLIAYDILPFQMEEQFRCITEQWVNVSPGTYSEFNNLKQFAMQCIKSVKFIQNDDIHDFLGVPLKCRILASVNEKQAQQLCKANRQRPLEVVEAATIKSVFDLYTRFVDCLVNKVAETIAKDARKDFVNGIITFYTHMALELLFPDLSNVYLKNCKIDSSMEELFRRVGVACVNNINQRLEFIHRSFAEYFVGRFFAEFWNYIEQYSSSFVHMVGSFFIRNVIIAVDGAFKINPDTSNESDEWCYLIKYKYIGLFSPFLDNKKVFQLKYPLILLFMNMNLKVKKLPVVRLEGPTTRFPNVGMSFENEANTRTQSLQPVDRNTNYGDELCELKKWLAKSFFATMMACIDERLTNLFSLYVQILISFFEPEERVALLLPNAKVQNRESTESVVLLLCRVAMFKSPENAFELFNLFGDSDENYLSVICQRYPEEYWSPLEVAIITEDIDMVLYFVDKISLPVGRLFIACVAVNMKLEKSDAKLKIMKTVLGSSDRVLNFLCKDSLRSYIEAARFIITKYSFQLLLRFFEQSKRSMSSIKSDNKRFIVEKYLQRCNDEELVNLLLSLYSKCDHKYLSIANLAAGRSFTAEEVLDALDLVEVRDAFSKVRLTFLAFDYCSNLETLKVLTAIQPDFSCCNYLKWNYLHVAASTLNIDWVKHLINSGYQVDQLDKRGSTPLLRASENGTNNLKSILAVTRLLVENGANVYAKNMRGGINIAHHVFGNCRYAESKDLCDWVSYLLENGYRQLWKMRDNLGRTPQEILISETGKNSPLTADVLRLLERHSVVIKK